MSSSLGTVTCLFEKPRVSGSVVVHAADCGPNLVAERVDLLDVARVEGCLGLNENAGAEPASAEENRDLDVRIL